MLRPGLINYGSSVRLNVTWEDEDGAAFDPDTVVFKTNSPLGDQVTYTYGTDAELQRTDVGQYLIDITADSTGRWHYAWGATDGTTYLYKEAKFNVQASPWYDGAPRAYAR